jgi:hypothetical protein
MSGLMRSWLNVISYEVVRLWRGSGGKEDGCGGWSEAVIECCECGGAQGGRADCVMELKTRGPLCGKCRWRGGALGVL